MQLFNTLTRDHQNIVPLDGQTVRVYSCGPTVYDHAHIGNLAAYIFADTLHRSLEKSGFKVKHVMNYTDVDDKTIRRSQQEFPELEPMDSLIELTSNYIKLFRQDMQLVGNDLKKLEFIKATDTIKGIQQHIKQLMAGGFAYLADDGIYFSIEKYRSSGKTYGQLLDITKSNTSAERIQNDEYDKESTHDFALWKTKKPGEPSWDFTIDGQNLAGRPGWHIECSVMSHQTLGQPFDIHTGGIDLIFPHHENEIAQSTALTKNPIMATVFAHNNHVLVAGQKMSKSAGNFFTLQDILAKKIDPLAFRLMILQTHYRNEAQFSWENLQAAQNRLQNWRATADLQWQASSKATEQADSFFRDSALAAAMQADLDTPKAMYLIDQLFAGLQDGLSENDQPAFKHLLETIDDYLGLDLLKRPDINKDQKSILEARQLARDSQNWESADKLRDELLKSGVEVRDTKLGQVWTRL